VTGKRSGKADRGKTEPRWGGGGQERKNSRTSSSRGREKRPKEEVTRPSLRENLKKETLGDSAWCRKPSRAKNKPERIQFDKIRKRWEGGWAHGREKRARTM